MGADMLLAVTKQPTFDEMACAAIELYADERSRIRHEVTDLTLRNVSLIRVENLELDEATLATLADFIDPDLADPLEVRRRCQSACTDMLEVRRDVTTLVLKGTTYLATGGLTWGDSPTPAYEAILLIDYLDIWAKPIDKYEVEAALYTGVAQCGICSVWFRDVNPSARCPFEYDHATTNEWNMQ